jgi:SAM-dependent methyltransferase
LIRVISDNRYICFMKKLYKFLLNRLPRPLLIRLSYPFKLIAPLLYKGNNVTCPVCEKDFSKFLSYGSDVAHRENVLCPFDLTLERHRLMWLYLKNETTFFTANKLNVLHIAPEQCFHALFKKQKNLVYTTGDLVSPIADLHFDLHEIPLENDLFDVVFCNHVMEHVNDVHQCMSEIYRVLKPGGWAIMQVPQDFNRATTLEDPSITSPEDREKFYWQKDHVRLFGNDYPTYLTKAGFQVEEYRVVDHFNGNEIERYRLQREEILYLSRK